MRTANASTLEDEAPTSSRFIPKGLCAGTGNVSRLGLLHWQVWYVCSGTTALGISNRDSGELSVSASRGGGIAATGCLWWKGHSPDYPTCSDSTDRAATGLGTTQGDSLSSLGKCLASPRPKGLTGNLTHSADASLPQSSSLLAWLWGSVTPNPPFPIYPAAEFT